MQVFTYEYENYLDTKKYMLLSTYIDKYGDTYLNEVINSLILRNKDDLKVYKNYNLITVSKYGYKKQINESLIRDIINDKGLYHYLLNNIKSDLPYAIRLVTLASNGKTMDDLIITKVELKYALELCDNINPTIKDFLINLVSEDNLVKKYNNGEVYNYNNIDYKISDLINILNIPKEEYNLINKENNKDKLDALKHFIDEYSILNKYDLSDRAYNRYKEISETDYKQVFNYKEQLKNIDIRPMKEFIKNTYNEIEKVICYLILFNKYYKTVDKKEEYFSSILTIENIPYKLNNKKIYINSNNYNIEIDINSNNIKCLNTDNISQKKLYELYKRINDEIEKHIINKNNFDKAISIIKTEKNVNYNKIIKETIRMIYQEKKSVYEQDRIFKIVFKDIEFISYKFMKNNLGKTITILSVNDNINKVYWIIDLSLSKVNNFNEEELNKYLENDDFVDVVINSNNKKIENIELGDKYDAGKVKSKSSKTI